MIPLIESNFIVFDAVAVAKRILPPMDSEGKIKRRFVSYGERRTTHFVRSDWPELG